MMLSERSIKTESRVVQIAMCRKSNKTISENIMHSVEAFVRQQTFFKRPNLEKD